MATWCLTLPIEVKKIFVCFLGRVKELPWGQFHLPRPTKEEEPKFISICNRDESSVDSKEAKQGSALLVKEEAIPLAEIHEKKPLLEGCTELCTTSFWKYYYPWKIISIMVHLFFIISKILSCEKRVSRMTVLNSSNSYHQLSACKCNMFYKECQISSPNILWKFFLEASQ